MGLTSLIVGTVQGLSQIRLKRLLTYSTISHVGFLLLGLSICSSHAPEQGLNAFLFYLIQYVATTILTFLVIIAFEQSYLKGTISKIQDLVRVSAQYKLLTFTIVLCLFSMSGIPPLVGFYAKLEILRSTVSENTTMLYLVAIICSVISASYYIRMIKIITFDEHSDFGAGPVIQYPVLMSSLQSYTISILIAFTCLFILDPYLILNSTEIAAITFLQS